jgi:hypothetical protein
MDFFLEMAFPLSSRVSSVFTDLAILTFVLAITGLGQAYSFGPEFAAALAAFAVGITGDPTSLTWSIGGPYTPSLLGGLLSNPEGISNSHNSYESDASPARVRQYDFKPKIFADFI